MEASIAAVESILNYTFNNKSLLEEALTHPSYAGTPSFQRLEFLGDSVLGFAISHFFYFAYPDIESGQLTDLRKANTSTEKLARVTVHHGLHNYIRHNYDSVLSDKVRDFVIAVEEEGMVVHGGQMKAPKLLADVVESIVAAVYFDCGSNFQRMWTIIKRILEPLVMLNVVLAQPHPISALFETCAKDGKHVDDIKYERNGDEYIASVFVDDTFIASGSSLTKENAKLHAAEAALAKLTNFKSGDTSPQTNVDRFNEVPEIEGAKQKVLELCDKKKWQKPTFSLEQESGPSHDRKYVSSIEFELPEMVIKVKGNEKSRKKDAENSAASNMLFALQGDRNTSDDIFVTPRSSLTEENAKLHAAEDALAKLTTFEIGDTFRQSIVDGFNELTEIEGAKPKVLELCDKKRWHKPTFRPEQEWGPSHDRKYVSSVEVEISKMIIRVKGNERSRKKDAENSAASNMLFALQSIRHL